MPPPETYWGGSSPPPPPLPMPMRYKGGRGNLVIRRSPDQPDMFRRPWYRVQKFNLAYTHPGAVLKRVSTTSLALGETTNEAYNYMASGT